MSNLKLESINNSSYGKRMVENDYMLYFSKNIHAKPIAYMSSPVADNLDFAETSALQMFEQQNRKIKYAVNSRFSTVRHIRENERNLLFISEALFKTYPTKKLIDAVDKLVKSDPGTTPIMVTYGQIGTIVDTNDEFYDSPVYDVTVDKPNLEISPLTRFTIPVFSNRREDFLRNFTKQIRAVGYEINDIVTYDVKTQPFHDKQIRILEIIVEARYNDMPYEMSDVLYHVSPARYFAKIRKHGLVPNSKSTEFEYPERVYMFNKQSILNLENYGINKTMSIPRLKSLDDSKFCIFKIDGEKIKTSPEFQTGKLKFYVDGSFTPDDNGPDDIALYTYDVICLKYIMDDVMIYDVNFEINDFKYEMINGRKRPIVRIVSMHNTEKLS